MILDVENVPRVVLNLKPEVVLGAFVEKLVAGVKPCPVSRVVAAVFSYEAGVGSPGVNVPGRLGTAEVRDARVSHKARDLGSGHPFRREKKRRVIRDVERFRHDRFLRLRDDRH